MITEGQVRKAIEFHGRVAADLGKAKENAIYCERYVKRVVALERKKHADKPANIQEREAYASDAFHKALIEEAKAAGELEKIRAAREHAQLTIEVWRTLEANHRAAIH
ncbi:MAG: hypothetical protein ACLP7P_08455 [Rhodomicrobium sp.]